MYNWRKDEDWPKQSEEVLQRGAARLQESHWQTKGGLFNKTEFFSLSNFLKAFKVFLISYTQCSYWLVREILFFFGSSTSLEFLNWLLCNFNDLISLVGLFTHRVPERAERHRNMDLREVRALPLDWHTRPLWWHPTGRYPTGAWVMGKFQRLGYEVGHELTDYPFQPHFSRKLFAIKKKGWWKEESGGLERCIDDRLMQVYVNLCVMAWMTGARLRPTGRGRGEA